VNPSQYESGRYPFVDLVVGLRGARTTALALVDSGFDGDLILPAANLAPGLRPDFHDIWTLADGTRVETPVIIGEVQLGNFESFVALVAFMGEEALAGRGIIDRFRMTFDHGRRLIVEA